MKNLSQAFLLIGLFMLSASTLAMEGTLKVDSGALRVKRDDGFYVRFYPGEYATSFTTTSRKINFLIDRKGIATSVTVDIPEGSQFPDNGAIDVPATKTGQSFDIEGSQSTTVTESPTYSDREPCTYYRREWVCEWHHGHKTCYWKDVPYQGWRDVEYRIITRAVDITMTLSSPGNGDGNLSGHDRSSHREYDYIGRCW